VIDMDRVSQVAAMIGDKLIDDPEIKAACGGDVRTLVVAVGYAAAAFMPMGFSRKDFIGGHKTTIEDSYQWMFAKFGEAAIRALHTNDKLAAGSPDVLEMARKLGMPEEVLQKLQQIAKDSVGDSAPEPDPDPINDLLAKLQASMRQEGLSH